LNKKLRDTLKAHLNSPKDKVKLTMDDKISQVIQQVQNLLQQGLGRPTIAKTLGISEHKAGKLMKEAKASGEVFQKAVSGVTGVLDSTLETVSTLVAEGLSEIQIAKQLGISLNSAVYWSKRSKAGSTKLNKIDAVRGLLDKGYETYDIAKAYQASPASTVRNVRKAENDFDPMQDWVRKAAKTGVRYSELKKNLNIKSLDKAKEIITENFPDCFIVETKLKDDIFLIPVFNSSNDIEWLNGPNKDKRFTYYVSVEENYMYIKIDDNLPEDTIEIFNVSDVHIGSRGHVANLYSDFLDIIKDNPNAFAMIGGDLTTQNHRTSVADPMDQYMRNTEQIKEAVRSLKRVNHKIFDWVGSNHDDDRADRVAQIKPGQIMASMTQVPYFPGQVIIDIEWRGIRKTILHAHNMGKAFSEEAILAAVKRTCSGYGFPINAVYLGHVHHGFQRRLEMRDKVLGRGIVNSSTWIINAGATEGRTGTWIEKEGMAPATQDIVYWSLRDDGKDWATNIPVHNA